MDTDPGKSAPTMVTREELYQLVWETPMIRLGERFGISGNGLAKICRRLDVPYPPRGHWAKKSAGKKVSLVPLPSARAGTPSTVRIAPTEPSMEPELPSELQLAVAQAQATASSVRVAERLHRPHAIIARWLADHEERKREARRERDPWRRDLIRPTEFSDQDRRRHRILDALFKELERQGARIIEGERRQLLVSVGSEKIEFGLREKLKQIRRPLTDKERQWENWNKSGTKQELQPTGFVVFTIKTYLGGTLRTEWLEKPDSPIEDLLPQIVATLIAAGPLLAERRRSSEEAARLRETEQRRVEEERGRRKRDQNRGRRFVEIARAWRDVAVARQFLGSLRELDLPEDKLVDGLPISEWILWAEEHLNSADPLSHGVTDIFEDIAKVEAWTYRD